MSATTAKPERQELELGITALVPCPANPRKHFPTDAHKSLVKSIQKHGITNNLLVMHHPDQDGRFMIIAGERRFRAAQDAPLDTVPCTLLEVTDALEILELQADENLDRVNLNPLEEAETFKLLMDAGKTQAAIAEKYQLSQSQISNRLRLLKLPRRWKKKLINGTVPVTFGRDLAAWIKWPDIFPALDRAVDRIKGNLPTGGILELSDYRAALADAIQEVGEPYYKLAPLGQGKEIQKELDVVIIPADLGGGRVIMNAERLADLLAEYAAQQEDDDEPDETPPADTVNPPHVPHENLFYDDAEVGPGEPAERTQGPQEAAAVPAMETRPEPITSAQESFPGPAVDYSGYWREWVRAEINRQINQDDFLAQVSSLSGFWDAWKPDKAFLELHTRDQLLALARAWELDVARLEEYGFANGEAMIDDFLIMCAQIRMEFEPGDATKIRPPRGLVKQGAQG